MNLNSDARNRYLDNDITPFIEFKEVLRASLKRKRFLIFLFIIGQFFACYFTFSNPKKYQSDFKLLTREILIPSSSICINDQQNKKVILNLNEQIQVNKFLAYKIQDVELLLSHLKSKTFLLPIFNSIIEENSLLKAKNINFERWNKMIKIERIRGTDEFIISMLSDDKFLLQTSIKKLFERTIQEPNSLKNKKFMENIKDLENILNSLKNENYLGNQTLIEESLIKDLIYESSYDLKILQLLKQNKYYPFTVLQKTDLSEISRIPILKTNIVLYGFVSIILGILIAYYWDKKITKANN